MKMYKKLMLIGFLLIVNFQIFAQNSAITSTSNYLRYGELDKAKTAIDGAVINEATKENPKAWLYRGQVYEAIARNKDAKYANLSANPLNEAVESYVKAAEYNAVKKKLTDEILRGEQGVSIGLQGLSSMVGNQGVNSYNKQEYATAISSFESYLKINNAINFMLGKKDVDTNIVLYIGNAAYNMKDYAKAKTNFERLADEFKYKDPSIYLLLSEMYIAENNNQKALESLDKGMLNATDKKNILINRLNIFMKQNNNEKAIEEGKKAIEIDPTNISIYLAVGSMYQGMNKPKEADEIYQRAIKQDPENFNTNYLLGINYYNMGAEFYNKSIEQKDPKKATVLENQAKDLWKKGLPFLEKAFATKPDDKDAGKYLAELYAKLGDMKKAMEVKSKIK